MLVKPHSYGYLVTFTASELAARAEEMNLPAPPGEVMFLFDAAGRFLGARGPVDHVVMDALISASWEASRRAEENAHASDA